MKLLLFFLLLSSCAYCQDYVIIKDLYGVKRKVRLAQTKNVLVVNGDSLYNSFNRYETEKLANEKGFTVISHPDSIQKFLSDRIKGIIILKTKDDL